MKKKFSKELIIGGLVLLALLILVFGINYLKGVNMFKPSNYYFATYTDVAGLAQSAPVTVNGFKVGLVREISYEYDNPGHIKVEMSLDRHLKLPRGTKALLTTDMLGTSSIALEMAPGKDFHNVGDQLIGANASGLMSSVTNDIMPSITAILPKIDSILTSMTTIVSDPALLASVQRLDKIMANIETSSAQLNTTMKAMPRIADDASGLMTDLKTISADLTALSAKLREMPIDSTMNSVNSIAARLNTSMEKLNSKDSSLGLLLNDTGLYNNLNASAAILDSLLKDVNQNPKRYISIKVF